VIFLRCHIRGFGVLSDIRLEFGPGLNVVYAPNEGGKTTLQRFLAAMLYGQFRADVPLQRRLEPWVEACQPWRSREYRGAVWIRLHDGRAIEIQRAFGRDAGNSQVLSATGEDVTSHYERLRNGEVLLGLHHLGLPKDLFESLAVVRENRSVELHGRDSIRDKIANLVEFGDEEHSVRRSVELLEQALEEIGSERAPTKPYRLALDGREALRQEKRELEARRAECAAWTEELVRRESEASRLVAALDASRAVARMARFKECEQRLLNLERIETELLRANEEIAACGGDYLFPAQYLDELTELVGARESVATRLAENRSKLDSAASGLAVAESKRREYERWEPFATGSDGDSVVELYHQHLGLTVQRDSCQRTATRLASERIALEQSLAVLPGPLADPAVDWKQRLYAAAEQEREGAERERELAARAAGCREAAGASRHRASTLKVAGAVSGTVSALLLALTLLWPLEGWWRYAPLLPAAVSAVAAVVLFRRGGGFSAATAASQAEVRKLESTVSGIRAESGRARREIEIAVSESGFGSVDEFLEAAQRAAEARVSLERFDERIRDAENQREKVAADCSAVFALLRDHLSRVGLSCSPGNLSAQMDHFRNSLKRFREADREHHDRGRIVEERTRDAESLAAEVSNLDERIDAILGEGGVSSLGEFRDACRRRLQLTELDQQRQGLQREFDRLRDGENLDELRGKVRRLKDEAVALAVPAAPAGGSLLPYLPSSAEAEEDERRRAGELASGREELAAISGRIAEAFRGFRTVPEIEEDLAAAEEAVANLELNRAALTEALETLRILAREQQEVLAPQLNQLVDGRFLRLAGGRYQEVKIDPELEIRVRERDTGELRDSRLLSRGTQDQLYFAMRFGVLDLLSSDDEPCPCLLDEPFAAYDRERSVEAFRILASEAERRQLLLFTCREDIRDLALLHGGQLIALGA
jgi:uncharacterized protein YhaN